VRTRRDTLKSLTRYCATVRARKTLPTNPHAREPSRTSEELARPLPEAQTVADQAPRLDWIKASRSYGHGECVELAADGNAIRLRDSKDPSVHLRFTRRELAAFLDGARRGEFDHLLS
jgi:hypothetical protein